jgi:Spy/CpxP family protein refolding chaperone
MKNLIRTFTVGAFLFSSAFITLNAQTGLNKRPPMDKNQKMNKDLTPEQRAQKFTDKTSTELQLNENQKKELYTLRLNDIKKRDELKKAEMDLIKNSEANFRKILTPEQIIKLDALKANRQENQGPKGPKKPMPAKN